MLNYMYMYWTDLLHKR